MDIICPCELGLTQCAFFHKELVQVDAVQCNRPHDNRHAVIEVMALFTPIAIYSSVILRLISRLWTVGSLWWDDWFHIIAAVRLLNVHSRLGRRLTSVIQGVRGASDSIRNPV